MNPVSPTAALQTGSAAGKAALALWHVGWAAACALLALGLRWLDPGLGGMTLAGVLVMAAPGLINLFLLRGDGPAARMTALGVWGLAALTASALTGGLTGPLAGFALAPVAAGLALGGFRLMTLGGAAAGAAILAGWLSGVLVSADTPRPGMAAIAALMTVIAAVAAARLARTDRRPASAPAADAVSRLESVLASQPGLTIVLDPSGRALAAYGKPPAGLPIDPLFESGLIAAVHAPDRAAVLSALDKALRGIDAQTPFVPRSALDRRMVLVVRRAADEPGRVIGQIFDGTAQYVREAGLEAARAEAEAQNSGKSRFLAHMSHELRTPLNAVLGFSEIMRRGMFGPLPPRYAEYANSIHEAGGHLLDMINDVLDVSRIAADRYHLNPEDFDAREVVSSAVVLMRTQADEKRQALSVVLASEPTRVTADRRALKQIALNLIGNAVKFTPAEGTVTVTLEAVGPYLELVVSDTGVGIAPDDLSRLGKPFEQAGDADQRAMGTGLGLSLVRSLAELHGGRMSIDSTLGEGTAVTVRLPIVPAKASVAVAAAPPLA